MHDGGRILQLHPELAIVDGPPVRLWHTSTARLEGIAPAAVASLLRAFVHPRPAAAVVAELAAQQVSFADTDPWEVIERCVAKGLLIAGEGAPVVRADALFGAPRRTLGQALVEGPDVAVVGVPYDAGATSRPGSRFGPQALRRASGTCFAYREEDGQPTGAWDPVAGRQVLAGVRMADVGDLDAVAPLRNGPVLDRLRQSVRHLAMVGSVPVVLGGDHSIALPVITGLAQAHGPIGVIQIDAHADRGVDPGGDWRTGVHHGNFLTWALRDERLTRLVQFGVRQREAFAPPHDPRVRVWAGTSATAVPLEAVLAELPADLPWHVTIDVDGLDPSVLAATGTPVPAGFGAEALGRLLAGIARHRRVVGIDLCELMPGEDETAGLVPCELLVQVLAAMADR